MRTPEVLLSQSKEDFLNHVVHITLKMLLQLRQGQITNEKQWKATFVTADLM